MQNFGAGNEARTRDLNLGKVALYQLSYTRIQNLNNGARGRTWTATLLRARDFKSLVSTNFTTRAYHKTLNRMEAPTGFEPE